MMDLKGSSLGKHTLYTYGSVQYDSKYTVCRSTDASIICEGIIFFYNKSCHIFLLHDPGPKSSQFHIKPRQIPSPMHPPQPPTRPSPQCLWEGMGRGFRWICMGFGFGPGRYEGMKISFR